jgi:hypothetical protein
MILRRNKRKELIFCISFQRTGTTSTGTFFKDHGYKVGDWVVSRKNQWGHKCFIGDNESIFNSDDFKNCEMFEDGPWWYNSFYRILYHRFPNAKFILLERDPDQWFNSMLNHSNGKVLGNTFRHMYLYNRIEEYYKKTDSDTHFSNSIDNLLTIEEKHREHYSNVYVNRNKTIKDFFKEHDSSRLFNGRLENKSLWTEMADYFNIRIDTEYSVHANKTK